MRVHYDMSELEKVVKNLSNSRLIKRHINQMAREIAHFCRDELYKRTPKKTGDLARGWYYSGGIRIIPKGTGCTIELANMVEYANAVNYGHWSYNQFNVPEGPPYLVKNRTVPYYSGNNADRFVFGRFFVEKTAVALEGNERIIETIAVNLQEWFRECING